MRNISQYPVTAAEVVSALQDATRALRKEVDQMIGGIDLYALSLLDDFLLDNEDKLKSYLASRQQ